MNDAPRAAGAQVGSHLACDLQQRLDLFLLPLLVVLDAQLDARLVRTVVGTVSALICWRNRAHGLLLSDLGAYLLSPAQAPAGTKRLSNLLRSPKWQAALIARFLWQQADARLATVEGTGQEAYVAWDESVLEKPESRVAEGLCPVRSSKAGRLLARKPGYQRPPGRPAFVPGLHWVSLLLLGPEGPPAVAAMQWWITRGARASDKRTEEATLLRAVAARWDARVLHLWDRGFAGTPWLTVALGLPVRFVLRWPTRYHLLDETGQERPVWPIMRGQRTWEHRLLWDGCCSATIENALAPLWQDLLRQGCHRTGQRSQATLAPLYRLRSALSRLWLAFPQPSLFQTSG